jgi:hypothetical protein
MDRKGYERKLQRPNLRYYPEMYGRNEKSHYRPVRIYGLLVEI